MLGAVQTDGGTLPDLVIQAWGHSPDGDRTLSPERLAEEVPRVTAGTLHLLQALAALGLRSAPRVYVMTVGHADGNSVTESALISAPLEGIARTAALEHPEFRCTTVDMSPQPSAGDVVALVDECLGGTDETQLAIRDGRRLAMRLQPWSDPVVPPSDDETGIDGP